MINKALMLYFFIYKQIKCLPKKGWNGMKESRYELKNWKRWKHTLILLNNTKEHLENEKKSLCRNNDHLQIIEKINNLIDEIKEYEQIIFYYHFFIERLESAINNLLNQEEKTCVLIYANEPDNAAKREYAALEKGISRTTYYKLLNSASNKLDKVLKPKEKQYDVKDL